MMMRSSSTPVLGSLLPSLSPENHHHHHDVTLLHPYKFSFGSPHFTTLSCNSSPISPSFGTRGIRRANSEGNLDSLINSGGNSDDDFSFFNPPKKLSTRVQHSSLLETIPSFSYQNSRFKSDEEEEDDDGFCEFGGFNTENMVLKLNKQMEMKDGIGESGECEMYLAKGLGADGSGGGGRNLCDAGGEGGGGGGDNREVEEHYRKMVNESPGNALLLGNYAQFLYQSKHDLQGAEEYYSRAILVDPNDGEILSQYAKLLWELHRDTARATTYFERAIQAASEDCHVHAAYASFLWETEGEEDAEEEEGCYSNVPPLFNNGAMATAATA